ncbi:hypothetical protein ES703_82230 [subsurface metagenome]
MNLRWNAEQVAIYELIQSGAKNKDLKAQGYRLDLVRKVRTAVNKGDAPPEAPGGEKEPSPGEPLYSATLKTTKVTLDPIVAVRYDSVRHALGWGNDYSLEQFLDEATDIVAELVGAVPPGFVKEEQKEAVPAGESKPGGD